MSHRIILVTGASSGFGAAIARRFARGWSNVRFVLVARRHERLLALAAELDAPCHVLSLDVRDRAEVERALSALPPGFDEVDVLVNNAGLALGLEPAHAADVDDWDRMIQTNVAGLTYVTRAVLPGMVARRRGHVVNLGSVAGTYPYPGGHVYGGTKAFVHQFSLGLRADLLGTSVRVTCIEPGMAETEFSVVRFGGDQARAAEVYRGVQPLSAEDVAEAVFWCADLPSHVNVNVLEVMPTAQATGPFAVHREPSR